MEIKCIRLESNPKGSFVGTCDIFIPKMQMEIFNCTLWMKNGRKWVNLPQRSFINENGRREYLPYIRFTQPETAKIFTELCLKAIDKYCEENNRMDNPLKEKKEEVDNV